MLDYWLGRCEGFVLASPRGQARGVVEDVVLDGVGHAHALVVRTTRRNGVRLVDAAAIEVVTPANETLTLRADPRPVRTLRPRRSAAPALGRGVRALAAAAVRAEARLRPLLAGLGRGAARAGVQAGLLVLAGTRWGAGRLRRHGPVLAAKAGAATRSAAAWARPRAAALARTAGVVLVAASLYLLALMREIALAAWAYGALLAREAGRRRAAAP